MERSHHLFKQWAVEHGMANEVVELYDHGVFTYKRDEETKTLIDHVMNSVLNTEFVKGGMQSSTAVAERHGSQTCLDSS